MNTQRVQAILRQTADRLDDPEQARKLARLEQMGAQIVVEGGHIFTISVHEVCPDQVWTSGEVGMFIPAAGNGQDGGS